MDLYLMDAILKGHLPEKGSVLDLGCGEGRNGIFFIKNNYQYHGIDQDASKIRLLEYLCKPIATVKVKFTVGSMQNAEYHGTYNLIIASRILHFAQNYQDFRSIWAKINFSLKPGGVLYLAMDSAIIPDLVQKQDDGKHEFHDGRISFCLTDSLYNEILPGFKEIEELKTVAYANKRVQSFALLTKA